MNDETGRLLLARQFTVGVDENNKVRLIFDYKQVPVDTREFRLGLSVPFATARQLAHQILAAADQAEIKSKA